LVLVLALAAGVAVGGAAAWFWLGRDYVETDDSGQPTTWFDDVEDGDPLE
jgi:hypothetical protein